MPDEDDATSARYSSIAILGLRILAAAGAVLFAALLLSLARVPELADWWLLVALTLTVVAAAWPTIGLCTLAATIPIAMWVGRQWHSGVGWPEVLVVAFLAGYCGRGLFRPARTRHRLDAPLLCLGLIVLASLGVQLLIDVWRLGGASVTATLSLLVQSDYFLVSPAGDPIDAALRLIEGLLLARAAAGARSTDPPTHRSTDPPIHRPTEALIKSLVVGAACAGALNVLRLWQSAARLDAPITEFIRILTTLRLNVHYPDVNAAGSYFMMALCCAVGLLLRSPRWAPAVAAIGAGLWVTGSRAALVAGFVAMLLPLAAVGLRFRSGRGRLGAVVAAALMIGLMAIAAAALSPTRGNQQSSRTAIEVRRELAATSLRMAQSAPVFGVGVGRYYARSGEFSSPELIKLFPVATRENAHNNFLQVLAELGAVGLAALLWVLCTVARASSTMLRDVTSGSVGWGAVTGLLAFALTWLAGHPMLIDEPAFAFWLLAGAVSSFAQPLRATLSTTSTTTMTVRSLGIAAAVVVLASIPFRVERQRADIDLEHHGIGLTVWQPDLDGVRYRIAGPHSTIFVPSAQALAIPMRAAGNLERRVELRLDGRPADTVMVRPDRWRVLRLALPSRADAPRFRRLDLRVVGAPSGEAVSLLVGKVEPR